MTLNRHFPMPPDRSPRDEAMWAWELDHPGVPSLPRMVHGVEAYERRLARETGKRRMYWGMGRGPLPRP